LYNRSVLKHSALFFVVALTGAGLDLLTKHLAFEHIQRYQEVTIIDGYFAYGRTTNPGVVFGMGAGAKKVWLAVSVLAVDDRHFLVALDVLEGQVLGQEIEPCAGEGDDEEQRGVLEHAAIIQSNLDGGERRVEARNDARRS